VRRRSSKTNKTPYLEAVGCCEDVLESCCRPSRHNSCQPQLVRADASGGTRVGLVLTAFFAFSENDPVRKIRLLKKLLLEVSSTAVYVFGM
jgi:hypothetical protein